MPIQIKRFDVFGGRQNSVEAVPDLSQCRFRDVQVGCVDDGHKLSLCQPIQLEDLHFQPRLYACR